MIKLIPNWREAWKWSSVRLAALGALASSLAEAFPNVALQTWALMPTEWRAGLEQYNTAIAIGFCVLMIGFRLTQVTKKDGKP